VALLDWIATDTGLRVEGERVYLRPPRAIDYGAWSDLPPALARLPAALGADLAGGRSVARGVSGGG